jgi:hypothetical protein
MQDKTMQEWKDIESQLGAMTKSYCPEALVAMTAVAGAFST